MTTFVRVARRDDIAEIAIDRLEEQNRLNEAALRQMRDALLGAERDGAAIVVITGTDSVFCTGGAVDGYPDTFSAERHQAYSREFVDLLAAMGRSPLPIIGRVNGDCLAGGTMLLNRCDLAIAVDDARFGLPELSFGGFPMLALATAIEQFPPKLLFSMAYLGHTIDAAAAAALHLVNSVVVRDDLDASVDAIATVLRSRSAPAIAHGRQTYYALLREQTESRLETARLALTVSAASTQLQRAARRP